MHTVTWPVTCITGVQLSWSGQKSDGKWHGRGVLLSENSVMKGRDEGEYVQGVRQGRWVEIYGDTRRDEGEYDNNKKQGLWVETYTYGTRREGEYVNGKKQGKWIETQANGTRVEGGYVDGRKQGAWVETRADGSRWEQIWIDDYIAMTKVQVPAPRYSFLLQHNAVWLCCQIIAIAIRFPPVEIPGE